MSKCAKPFTKDGVAYGCGQCLPCRTNKRRILVHRLMLEGQLHADKTFVTLTYDEDHNPTTLVPADLSGFMRKLRDTIRWNHLPYGKLRYYGVGEYGDQSERPHYHLALFGLPNCTYVNTRPNTHSKGRSCCTSCDLVRNVWKQGNVYLGSLTDESANYIGGYVTKKLNKSHPALGNRYPEFSRASNRPGIGHDALWEVANVILSHDLVSTQGDVPSALRHGSRILPLGPYLTRKLRIMCGEDPKTPEWKKLQAYAEVYHLYQAARSSSEAPSLKWQLMEANKGRVASLEAKNRIFKKRTSI